MTGCSPEMARSIVNLLLNDPGTARLTGFCRAKGDQPDITQATCRGCDRQLTTEQISANRQFCSRICYESHLEGKRGGPLKPKAPKPMRKDGSLGPGKRFSGEPYEYVISRAGQPAEQVRAELLERFALVVGITTIFRAWRRHAAGQPAPKPLPLPCRSTPATSPSPPEPEAPMLSTETKKATDEALQIARRLKAVLARKGISQHAAGEAAGVSQTVVSKACRGNIIAEKSRAALLAWLEFEEGGIPTKDVAIESSTPMKLTGPTPEQVAAGVMEHPADVAPGETVRVVYTLGEDEDEVHDEIAAAVANMEPYPETRTLQQAVNGLGVLPASDDEPIALTVPNSFPPVGPPSPVDALSGFEKLRREFAITGAELERYDRRSPADVMLEQVARRGALAELGRIGLELPEGARITVSLAWSDDCP